MIRESGISSCMACGGGPDRFCTLTVIVATIREGTLGITVPREGGREGRERWGGVGDVEKQDRR
jgi:hypothetical protein